MVAGGRGAALSRVLQRPAVQKEGPPRAQLPPAPSGLPVPLRWLGPRAPGLASPGAGRAGAGLGADVTPPIKARALQAGFVKPLLRVARTAAAAA